MAFKYETHMHTKSASLCASANAKEMVEAYIEAGYSGMILTEHFFNGNTSISKDLPWEERVALFTKSYYEALGAAKGTDFNVFFAWEWSHKWRDFLTYGLDVDFLYKFPNLLSLTIEEYFDLAHEHGALISHAHPFRIAPHIQEMTLYPDYVDAIEVVNGAHTDRSYDDLALAYAREHSLLMTSGTDIHHVVNVPFATGMEFDFRLGAINDFVKAVKEGDYRLIESKRY